ncbi:hypothetical protein C457_11241 [Haloferax prahovense DSM 18310]|uniref:Integrase catalytic domain-containing protein n=1 Tax=Haloferax prahovense (strain DSM 18310 / JCM 13924 / TL6) TaxID=1227461 RepID=M0G8Q7_HALPT|nr:hypothetical protein [Haloferax prahovense]ELZ68575.1 hypothetical protein C457_11241 [Haloferax prahovense DSM 18310]
MTTHQYQQDAYPYNHDGESLGFEVTELRLDGDEQELPKDPSEFPLFEHDEAWDTAEFDVELSVTDDTLNYVFPPNEVEGALVVAGYAPQTHGRFIEPIKTGDLDQGTYSDTIVIERESYRGRVEFEALLIRNDYRPDDDEYARQSGRMLAHGPYVDLYLDPPRLSLSGDLPVIPADFNEDDNPGKPGAEWHVDVTDAAKPKLYLNEASPTVVAAVNAIERPTKQGLIGRVALNHLAVSMLTQFTIKAATHAVIKGGIEYDWQETLLTDLCGDYFTDGTVDEFESSLGIEAISTTINEVEAIYQQRQQPYNDVKRLLETI